MLGLGIGLLVIATGCALFFFLASPFGRDLCGNDIVAENVSPNGQLKAITFRRDCGATTSYSIQVSILPTARKLPNEGGNILVLKDDPALVVHWVDDHHLRISGGGASTSFLRLTDFHNIHIDYQ